MGEIENLIQTILSKHIVVFTPDYRIVIYNASAHTELITELQKYQNEHTDFKWILNINPLGTAEFMDPDNYCMLSWIENGELKIFGFGIMSEPRESVFKGQQSHL